jgi:MOSC domain-containing protein YiiM
MKVLHVNLGRSRPLPRAGGELSAIGKRPVEGAVAVHLLGLDGDEQADLTVHGGPSKAVYAYPQEHYGFWRTVRAQAGVGGWDDALPPGAMGENLTVEGLSEERLWIGDRLFIGGAAPDDANGHGVDGDGGGPDEVASPGAPATGCVLAVSEPRQPCHKFNAVMGFAQAGKLMAQSGYCGAYLAVLRPGTVRAGDPIVLVPGPREVNLRELFKAKMGRR